jgi:DNA-binding transcriptional LysR family regulator
MEIRHLRHFLAVAEELHMGRAAHRLGMTQPPLSQSIARLEKELGVKLFDRANRRLTLTRAGEVFLPDAKASVRHADMARLLARATEHGEAGDVRIGFVSAALYEQVPRLLSRLRKTHPHIRARLTELSTNEQLAALADGALDIGFAHPPLAAGDRLDAFQLPTENLVAVVPDDGSTDAVTLADIACRGLILFPESQGPTLHARIMDTFTKAGLHVRVVQEATRALTMLSLVSAGLGMALLPQSTRRVDFRGVRYASISDTTLPALSLVVIARQRPRAAVIERAWKLATTL